MELIIGGAYQGKTCYAAEKFGITEENTYTCSENEMISFDRQCVDRVEEFVLYCVKNGLSAREIFETNRGKWGNKVIICREIFSGVVPVDTVERLWREETGRVLTWLSSEACGVTRLFCGIPQKLK